MLFNSWQFAVFFPVVFALYWGMPHRFRTAVLLIASYWFYMSWNVKYVVLILFTTLVSYSAALMIHRADSQKMKRLILAGTLIACLGVLFVFKYFNFFAGAFADFLNMFALHLHPMTLKLLLPVGISFYTFQTLSYVIDVYRGNVKPEQNFFVYALFVSYFPQLVAGPIERTNNLLPQIKAVHEFNYEQATYGVKLMTWGFFKKLCIADVLAVYVDRVFADVYSYEGFALVLAVGFFTLQIYCDFSGYSDIARGCSKMLGIDLMENFRSPYFSASIREFWSRWHISLSTWFRDYVYIPLGGSRCGKFRHSINLMITFMISGLWHGADWTFVIWGAVHGLGQIVENTFAGRKQEVHGVMRGVRVCLTFLFVMMAWVFFRAQSLSESMYVFTYALSGAGNIFQYIKLGCNAINLKKVALFQICMYLLILFIYDCFSAFRKVDAIDILSRKSKSVRWTAYLAAGLVIAFFSPKGVATEFVYFQF
ncbi:MAG: MBOAT family protein [Synergistaceae bacterium]|nr:MBOAT family protein [Synergistaceae bacterium]